MTDETMRDLLDRIAYALERIADELDRVASALEKDEPVPAAERP